MSETVVLDPSAVEGFRPGDLIGDKYRLEREVGRGAMGTVWAAMHVSLGQKVAIKLIAAEHAGSNDARLRFGLEAKAAARLKSRHVVQVYDSGHAADGTPYIVMEYLEGQTLEERLAESRDLGLEEAVRITTHVGRALARAHAQGIIHRDLKSGNIFIAKSDDDEQGWVAKVLDFGVAKLMDAHAPSTTKTGSIVGTPRFMSPEQIRGASKVDQRADLYSLGMVFYNMVTGSHAFDGPSYSDVLVAICTAELPPIRRAAPWLPPELATWFEKACARERADRFQSADELVEALQAAAEPKARAGRDSGPDDGPASTLLGHIPPHAATLQLAAPHQGAAALIGAARPAAPVVIPVEPDRPARPRSEAGAYDRGPSVTQNIESTPRPNARQPLIVWAAAGVGLGVIVLLVFTLVARSASTSGRPSAAAAETARASPPVPAPSPERPLGPSPSPAPAPTPVASAPASPPSAKARTSATTGESPPSRAARSPRPTTHAAPPAAPLVTLPKPAPESPKGAPDMGF
jgi:eukaryotic-like serine/threonine-protein kinase